MEVYQLYAKNSLRNFSYLVASKESSKDSYCIDPVEATAVIDCVKHNSLNLKAIIVTHNHPDHFSGCKKLKQHFGCRVFAHENCHFADRDEIIREGSSFSLNRKKSGERLQVIETFGHTLDHISLTAYQGGKIVGIFTGDTLFNAGVGNCHSGDPSVLYRTISDLLGLDDAVLIYPGHDYCETNLRFTLKIEEDNQYAADLLHRYKEQRLKNKFLITSMSMEKRANTFLRLDQESVKTSLRLTDPRKIFLRLRALRNNW